MIHTIEKPSDIVPLHKYLEELQKNSPNDVVHYATGMQFDRQCKYVSLDLSPKQFPHLQLFHITDVQWGHICSNKKRFEEYRDWVLADPSRFVLFGGDMIDAATCLSKGKPYTNEQYPTGQLFEFCEAAMPMRHRILGYVGGNHERHGEPGLGGSLGEIIATNLRVPYSDGQQFISIHYGKWKPFRVSLTHGRGAARTKGAKLNMLHSFMQQGDSDLYLVGHLHDVMVTFDWRMERNEARLRMNLRKIGGAMSSSFLEFWGTYAEQSMFDPSSTMMARAIIEPNGHWELTLR